MAKTIDKSGFTLIEVMIALAILSMMSILIYSSTSQTIQGQQFSEAKDELNHSASLFLGKISSDLQMAFLLGQSMLPPDGKSKTVFSGESSSLSFPSFSHYSYFKDNPKADFGLISYDLENDREDSSKKVLIRKENPGFDDKAVDGVQTEAMVEGVKDLRFEYYDADKKEWQKSWDSSQLENAGKLPKAVKIELRLVNEDGEDDLLYQTVAEIKMYQAVLNF